MSTSASMPNTGVKSPTHVAVGILTDDKKILITRRSLGSHQGGKWEFPGGKLEPGEQVFTALKRELYEEIGIDVQQASPFMQVVHAYPDKNVLLDVWRVSGYRGSPTGREGQETRWVRGRDLLQFEFPEADWPIMHRLWLPPLYLITDARRFGLAEFLVKLECALVAGARLVQLREPHLLRAEYLAYARDMASLCHQYGAKLLLNAEPDWVAGCGADGVHLNSRRLMACGQRPLSSDDWVAASCHDAAELKQATIINADFAVLSPVAKTASHPEAEPLGWEIFQALCANVNIPVFALGGMRAQDIDKARAASAQGLAMVSEVWGVGSIASAIAALVD